MSLQIKEGQKAFVKKVEVKEKFVSATLTTGRKGQDEKYINSFWNTKFVGKAKDAAGQLGEGDRIELTSAIMTKEKATNDKYYDNLTVFGFEVISKGKAKEDNAGFKPVEEEDDLPF
jgi:hypothetical protein